MLVLWLIVGGMLFVTILAHFFVQDFHRKIFQLQRSKLCQHQGLAEKIHKILDTIPLHYLPKGLKCLLAKKELLLRQEIMRLKSNDKESKDNFDIAKSRFELFRKPDINNSNYLPQHSETVRKQLRALEEVVLLLYQQNDIDKKIAKAYINYIGQLFVQNMLDKLKSDAATAAANGDPEKALELYDKLIKKLISGNDNNQYAKKISYLIESKKQIQHSLSRTGDQQLDELSFQKPLKKKW